MILQLERCRVVFPDWYDERPSGRPNRKAGCKGWRSS